MEKPDIRDSRERKFLSEVQWSMGEKNIILKEKKCFIMLCSIIGSWLSEGFFSYFPGKYHLF